MKCTQERVNNPQFGEHRTHKQQASAEIQGPGGEGFLFFQAIIAFLKAWHLFTLSELAVPELLVSRDVPSSPYAPMAVSSPRPYRLSREHSTSGSPGEHRLIPSKLPLVATSQGLRLLLHFCRTMGRAVLHCQSGDKCWPAETPRRMQVGWQSMAKVTSCRLASLSSVRPFRAGFVPC